VTFKKLTGKVHLWLGLSSGLIVFIIAVTGCIYAFQEEIQNLTQPYRVVEAQQKQFLPPSEIQKIAESALPNKHLHAVLYQGTTGSARAIFYSDAPEEYYYKVYINQYTGEVLKVNNEEEGFFPFILDGHFYLWLPHDIGKPVVASATLVFLVMVISGIILWWPKNKNGGRQRFTIKWDGRWRRKNYDLHNVMGFYVMWVGVIFAITGLVWGFEWFMKSYYKTMAGGKDFIEYSSPKSALNQPMNFSSPAIDQIWQIMKTEYPQAGAIEVHIPEGPNDCIAANANPDPSTYWKIDYRYFDQYTLKELPVDHMWGRLQNASGADKLMRMNYDIHVGAVLGLPGKILAFCMSLIIASLPVTGTLIWWGRKKKSKAQNKGPQVKIKEQQLEELELS
jgi:uncharacterized iron-regulated membrane protein